MLELLCAYGEKHYITFMVSMTKEHGWVCCTYSCGVALHPKCIGDTPDEALKKAACKLLHMTSVDPVTQRLRKAVEQ